MAATAESPVLILTGPPGVGKTTIAGLLTAGPAPAVHLEADAFFRFVRGGYVEPWRPEAHEQNRLVMGIVAEVAAAYASGGYLTVVEGIVIPRWFLAPLRDGLRAAGHEAAYAVARAPLADCTSRLERREGLLAEPAAMERLWAEFADLGELEGHAVEVAGRAPEEAAAEVAARLRAGDLTLPPAAPER